MFLPRRVSAVLKITNFGMRLTGMVSGKSTFYACGITVALPARDENQTWGSMKKALLLAVAFVIGWLSVATAQVWVRPHTRNDGTYVDGHYRSRRDGNPHNNYSYPVNVNPYTGKEVTGDPNAYLER